MASRKVLWTWTIFVWEIASEVYEETKKRKKNRETIKDLNRLVRKLIPEIRPLLGKTYEEQKQMAQELLEEQSRLSISLKDEETFVVQGVATAALRKIANS
ncbi:hypothetical protein A2797_02260 [candidate division WWE3 bacterium RIFCSPHIGHO2_01_FULL_48_15]|uniref:Uncharacterized protein n=1 Tax=candidate division WWE3 bacterium RIFCSPHIGHO2_01_FULL_48_15 TaxID=1802619 RepID=A0A1F4VBY7_UNCKA|nr:MAG: hypothetical protein A2797_02260 [candidate division WWE3 bacterium RIFCSPHIGHO2_01_FULL_48_15]